MSCSNHQINAYQMNVVQDQLNTQIKRAEQEKNIVENDRKETAKKLQMLGKA